MEAFMERIKAKSVNVSGAPECMQLSGFMHGITNPDLIKKLNDNIPKFINEMMSLTTAFLRGESNRRQDRFTPLTKTPKEILAMDTVMFKALPPMTGPVENRNKNKFYEFHSDKGHSTDECIHLRRQIEEAVKSGQLSHLVKEIKQGGKQGEQAKAAKKGETPNKEKATEIFMVQPSRRPSHPSHVRRWRIDLRSAIRTLLQQALPKNKKPNGAGDNPPPRVQQRNILATGANLANVKGGIVTIRSTTTIPAEFRMVTEAQDICSPKEPTKGVKVAIHPEYLDQTVMIGEILSEKGRMELCNLLKENLDIFAWKSADVTGIPCSIAKHRLNIHKGCQPIQQKEGGRHWVGTKQSKRKSPS
nr:reverse transcriptase domain-containing protein [Tanacetum cinerariifolium]